MRTASVPTTQNHPLFESSVGQSTFDAVGNTRTVITKKEGNQIIRNQEAMAASTANPHDMKNPFASSSHISNGVNHLT